MEEAIKQLTNLEQRVQAQVEISLKESQKAEARTKEEYRLKKKEYRLWLQGHSSKRLEQIDQLLSDRYEKRINELEKQASQEVDLEEEPYKSIIARVIERVKETAL